MGNQIQSGRLAFGIGLSLCTLGGLMMCECPWMFAIAAVAFGIAAATENRALWRWAAVACIGLAAAIAIKSATNKEQARNNALESIRRADERTSDKNGAQDGK